MMTEFSILTELSYQLEFPSHMVILFPSHMDLKIKCGLNNLDCPYRILLKLLRGSRGLMVSESDS